MTRYEALATELEQAIRGGVLRPGDRLPSVRQTSKSRRLSASTVFQAYYLLEARGLIHARERSGYFVANGAAVLPLPHPVPTAPVGDCVPVQFSDRVFEMFESAAKPQLVPLGSPFPDPSLFPLAQLGLSMAQAARAMSPRATVDGLSPGKESLRRQIAQRYVARGVNVHHDEIVITNGTLEALNLCLSTVARPGDAIVVESPCFIGALQALERMAMRAVEVPTFPCEGIDLDRLEQAIRQHKPKACWLMPTFHNPLGATMSDERKQRLYAILSRHGLPLIEDDAYGELHHGDTPLRPLKAWDAEGLVLHCSSFTKSLAPGYRIGWAAPGKFFREVARQKVLTTLMASMPGQAGIAAYLQRGGYDRHLRKLRQVLAARHLDVAQAVCRHFPEGTCATRPEGGYCLWLQMPHEVDAFEMQRFAAAHGISLAPGPLFSASQGFANCIRLNFSHGMNERTERALALLGKFAKMATLKKAA